MLGKDAAKSEYWHFKDDNTRIYIRMEEEVPVGLTNAEMADESGSGQEGSQAELAVQKESTQVDSAAIRHTSTPQPVQSMIITAEPSKQSLNDKAGATIDESAA